MCGHKVAAGLASVEQADVAVSGDTEGEVLGWFLFPNRLDRGDTYDELCCIRPRLRDDGLYLAAGLGDGVLDRRSRRDKTLCALAGVEGVQGLFEDLFARLDPV
jgi:hypothetical protein